MSMDEKLMQRVKEGWKECCILNDSIAEKKKKPVKKLCLYWSDMD